MVSSRVWSCSQVERELSSTVDVFNAVVKCFLIGMNEVQKVSLIFELLKIRDRCNFDVKSVFEDRKRLFVS